jgi:endonuclease/exonuclease/phosphatase family metal-dependent hydrolase
MKIISWNIYKDNRRVVDAISFLKKQNADVLCLQEFPVGEVDLLQRLGMHLLVEDHLMEYRNEWKDGEKLKLVIASKYPFHAFKTIPHTRKHSSSTHVDRRYTHFKANSFYADINTGGGVFRVFNAHFKCVASPRHRLAQFKDIISNLSSDRHNIICGDFNTFGRPLLNIFIWKYFGYSPDEIGINERKILSLTNPFHKTVTFLKFPVQLDYILLPVGLPVLKKRRLRSVGSDHFPLTIEV